MTIKDELKSLADSCSTDKPVTGFHVAGLATKAIEHIRDVEQKLQRVLSVALQRHPVGGYCVHLPWSKGGYRGGHEVTHGVYYFERSREAIAAILAAGDLVREQQIARDE